MGTKLVIIGGVAGGASAATRARRLDESAEITIFERSSHISFANCGLPYYIGGVIQKRSRLLLASPRRMWDWFRIKVHVNHEVTAIDRDNKRVTAKNLKTGEEVTAEYDKLIIATGAAPVVPPIPGADAENIFTLRTLEDADNIAAFIKKQTPRRALVVGAGFVGLEMVENFVRLGIETTLVELMPQILPPLDEEMTAPLLEELLSNGVNLYLSRKVVALNETNGSGRAVARLDDGTEVPYDICLLSVGVRPEVELAKAAGLKIGETGGIATDEYQRTSDPDIFAVGDACEYRHLVTGKPARIPLAGPANKAGRVAGENAVRPDNPVKFPGAIGTAIVKVFEKVAAVTGLSEKAAQQAGIPYRIVYAVPLDHSSYYPGAERMTMKVVWSADDGRLLGAQIVGPKGVDKRMDVIATAIYFGAKVEDLCWLDLAYAPQFGSAKDPVNMVGFVAENVRRGLLNTYGPKEALADVSTAQYLDVRDPGEDVPGPLTEVMRNIPLAELRDNLSELDPEKPLYVVCAVGQRAYIASRILQQNGFKDVRHVGGGCVLVKALDAVNKARQSPATSHDGA